MPSKCKTTGKDRHTPRSAINAALSYSKKRGTPLRIYVCPDCGDRHLTKQPKREKADR